MAQLHGPKSQLSPERVRFALRASVVEGCAWALMVGLAETYFVATAVYLGAGPLALGLVVALPLAFGGLGPLLAIASLRARPRRRRISVTATSVQASLLVGLALLLWFDRLDVALLVAGICVYQISAQAAGTAWSSWYGDLVPAARRGRYFSRRNRLVYLSTCVGVAAGGLLMQQMAPTGVGASASGRGFALLFGLAALCRYVSSAVLARSPEPRFRGLLPRAQVFRFARTERGGQALRILLLGSLFHFPSYWSSPYFAPFMLTELKFRYAQYMAASLTVIIAKAAFASLWGHWIDRRGAKIVFLLSMFCIAIIPGVWLLAGGLGLVMLAQAFSGSSWAGYEVGYLSLLLENSRSKVRPYVFALQSLGNGWMQLTGVLVASLFILPRVEGYRAIFAVSAVGRLLVAMAAPLVLVGVRRTGRAALAGMGWRVFGLRAHGGFSVRPILPSGEGEEDS